MKPILTLLTALLLAPLPGSAIAGKELFDFDWRFARGEMPGAETAPFDDSKWESADLPHDFCIHGPFDPRVPDGKSNGYRPRGVAWYRKTFVSPANATGKLYRLDFEGVFQRAKVWVNGVLLVENSSGWHGFECEVSKHMKPVGERNVVLVRADASRPEGVTWYNGGGIYRYVWLVASGEIHVARHGTFVRTPKISAESALVSVQTEIANDSVREDGSLSPAGIEMRLSDLTLILEGIDLASVRRRPRWRRA